MNEIPEGDPYVESVLGRVPADVARTLSREQWNGLREALRRTRAAARHAVDLRFVLPLYFFRLYGVFILGRDRRRAVREVLHERRRRATGAAAALVLALTLVFLAAVVFLVLYVVKSAAGIDIFPNFHLTE